MYEGYSHLTTSQLIDLLKKSDPTGNKEAFVYDEFTDKSYGLMGGGSSQLDEGVALHITTDD